MAYWQKTTRPTTITLRIPATCRSVQQADACREVVQGSGHVVIEAVAGSGKTESLTHILSDYSKAFPAKSVLCLAFGTDIKTTLETRIPESVADVKTCHGCGYGSPSRASKVALARGAYSIIADGKWGEGKASNLAIEAVDGEHLIRFFKARIGDTRDNAMDDIQGLCKLLSLAKTCLVGIIPVYSEAGKLEKLERDPGSVVELIARFGIEFSEYLTGKEAAEHVLACMEWNMSGPGITFQKKQGRWQKGEIPTEEKRTITFDDMMWLPLVKGWAIPRYDLVLVDECQDLSPARLQIVMLSLKPGGKIVAVGDRYQAIFGFAGAECDAMEKLINRLNAKVLPLSVTYRCARLIVDEAAAVNSAINIQARDNAPDGTVDYLDAKKLLSEVKAGNAIISRTNAPLVKLFFTMAKGGIPCVMLGKDYAAMLTHRIKSWRKRADSEGREFDGLCMLQYNADWLSARLEKLGDGNASAKERAHDEHDTVKALCEDLPLGSTETPKTVVDRCYKMFSKDNAKDNNSCVVLSSTHKFKGDERGRVFLLIETYKPGESKNGRAGEAQEETNLLYVGITRAKDHLTYITGLKGGSPEA